MFGKFKDLKKVAELKSKMSKIEKQFKTMRIEESGMDGRIKVAVNGLGEVVEVKLDPQLFEGKVDVKKIEKTLINAINSAQKKAKNMAAQKMQELMNELPPEVRRMMGA